MALENVLAAFGIEPTAVVTPIYKSAWDVGQALVLKKSGNPAEFDRSIALSAQLLSKGLPVTQYRKTVDGRAYVVDDDACFCLMKRIAGQHMDPFSGDGRQNGILLGEAVAKLHRALSDVAMDELYEAEFSQELDGWMMPALEENRLIEAFDDGVLATCRQAAEACRALPRQIIHRDMHPGNLLFEDGRFSGYLDFDISQRNVRVFDVCYLGCSLLVGNYQDDARLGQWRAIFSGILNGYEAVQALSQDERDALPGLFVLDELLFTAFFARQGQAELAQSCVHMTNWLHQHIAPLLKTCHA